MSLPDIGTPRVYRRPAAACSGLPPRQRNAVGRVFEQHADSTAIPTLVARTEKVAMPCAER